MTAKVSAVKRAEVTTDPATGRLRVVFQLRVPSEAQQQFLDAYQRIRYQVAATDGHLVDQLCQSTEDPCEWMITSEWVSPEHFLAWERQAGHQELAGPLVAATTQRRSLRYLVRHQTLGTTGAASDPTNPVTAGGTR